MTDDDDDQGDRARYGIGDALAAVLAQARALREAGVERVRVLNDGVDVRFYPVDPPAHSQIGFSSSNDPDGFQADDGASPLGDAFAYMNDDVDGIPVHVPSAKRRPPQRQS